MAWKEQHKHNTRQKILRSAAKLFTKQGFDYVGINDVMKDAGLTRGAFYAHFNSKSELYAEAIIAAAIQTGDQLNPDNPKAPSLDQLVQFYLSMEHRQGKHFRCPLAFLATDITQRDDQVRDAYTSVFKGFLKHLTAHLQRRNGDIDRARIMQVAVMMIGGLAVSRALNDDELAKNLLTSCHKNLLDH